MPGWAQAFEVQGGGAAAPGMFAMFMNMGAPPGPTRGPAHSGPTHSSPGRADAPPSPDDAPQVRILDPDRDKRPKEWREQIRDGDADADSEDESKQ